MRSRYFPLIAIAVVLAVSPFVSMLEGDFLLILMYIGFNIILASSLNLINGFTGQFSLGHAGFMGVGAYTSAIISTSLAAHGVAMTGITGSLVLVVSLLIAGLIAAIAGFAVGYPSLRLRGDYLAIVTLGFNEIIRVIIQNIDYVGGARGFTVPKLTTFAWTFTIAIVVVWVISNLVNSTFGRGFLAVRDDEVAAEAMGINTTKFKVRAFVIGAFFAGIGGGLFGHFMQYINPDSFTFMRSIDIVIMVILGGMGSTPGVIVGAIVLSILPEALRGAQEFRPIIYSAMLIALMILRPQGLFGTDLIGRFSKWRNRGNAPTPISG